MLRSPSDVTHHFGRKSFHPFGKSPYPFAKGGKGDLARSQVDAFVVIQKSGKAGKTVISAGMPKSRPWTVISRLC